MPESDRDAVYGALREAIEPSLRGTEAPRKVWDVTRDGWYPLITVAGEYATFDPGSAVVEVASEAEADHTQTVDGETRHENLYGGIVEELSEVLTTAGFKVDYIGGETQSVRVYGWQKPFDWYQTGDYVKAYQWKTPLELTAVSPAGESIPEESPTPVRADGTRLGKETGCLFLEGSRGGQYAITEDLDLYIRTESNKSTLSKTNELSSVIFVGNPETGPRMEVDN